MDSAGSPTPDSTGSQFRGIRLPRFRWVLLGALGLLAILWVVPALVETISEGGGLASFKRPYLLIGLFVAFDAVIPVLPSESLLTTAATLSAQSNSTINVWLVFVAGGLGATIGDSMLYWIARTGGRSLLQDRLAKIEENPKAKAAIEVLGDTAPLLIVAGRFVPGLRFIVNATMGVGPHPYPKFLVFSSFGSLLWAGYTCAFSFLISGALDGYPLLSIGTSALVTTALLALLYFPLKRRYDEKLAGAAEPEAPAPAT